MRHNFIKFDPVTGKIKGRMYIGSNKPAAVVLASYPHRLVPGIDYPEELHRDCECWYDVDLATRTLKKCSAAEAMRRNGVEQRDQNDQKRKDVLQRYAQKPERPNPREDR